jgi:hypothetical protein
MQEKADKFKQAKAKISEIQQNSNEQSGTQNNPTKKLIKDVCVASQEHLNQTTRTTIKEPKTPRKVLGNPFISFIKLALNLHTRKLWKSTIWYTNKMQKN